MNVAFDSWIPVVNIEGKRELTSLCNIFTEGNNFSDLAVRPHERVALMRLFICVAHAALQGPKDYDTWCEVPKRLPDAALAYLNSWKDFFELFNKEKPWLQVAKLSKNSDGKLLEDNADDWMSVSKLNFSFATGNNATLFDHDGMSENRRIPLADTILSMLTYQCFSPGGLISQVYWNGIQSSKSSKDGPCVPASMIHALLRGNNLLETIQLNLPTSDDIQFSYGERDFGKPLWEMMPISFNDATKVQNATTTYMGRLVAMTRLIHLHPSGEKMLLGDGLIYPAFMDGFPAEPTATVVIRQNGNQQERTQLSYQPSKALWRQLAAVTVKRSNEGTGGPLTLRAIQDDKDCDLIVAALARDKATIIDTTEAVFHIPARLRTTEGTSIYASEVKSVEILASRLGWAIEVYRKEYDAGWEGRLKSAGPSKGKLKSKLQSIATTHYWTAVEKNLTLLMSHIESIGTDIAIPTRDTWHSMLFKAACDAYCIACSQETPRQIKAFTKGWQKLIGKKNEAEPETNEITEEVEL